jgi:hypothetical protein
MRPRIVPAAVLAFVAALGLSTVLAPAVEEPGMGAVTGSDCMRVRDEGGRAARPPGVRDGRAAGWWTRQADGW